MDYVATKEIMVFIQKIRLIAGRICVLIEMSARLMMGQDDILEVLKKNGYWMIVGEIMSILGITRSPVNRALRKLFKDGSVIKREVPIRRGGLVSYLWKYKD